MNHFELEIARTEARTPLFYHPYHIELKSDTAKHTVAHYFYSKETSNHLSIKEKDLDLLNAENMKELSGKYTFHYDDPLETDKQRKERVRSVAPKVIGYKDVTGFVHFRPDTTIYGICLEEGRDFEVVVGERVEIEQPVKLSFDDIPDLRGVEK